METTAIYPTTFSKNEARRVATLLEQQFLEEMLKYSGLKAMEGTFSGGIGEEQFTSFLAQEYAKFLANDIDLGLENYLQQGKK